MFKIFKNLPCKKTFLYCNKFSFSFFFLSYKKNLLYIGAAGPNIRDVSPGSFLMVSGYV